jgi:DNA polymerase V
MFELLKGMAHMSPKTYRDIHQQTGQQYSDPDITSSKISAGFPSPAQDYLEPMLDLNKALVKNPNATFFGRVNGSSMKDAGIDNGDLLVIDKSLNFRNGALAVCFVNGEFTVKRIKKDAETLQLISAKASLPPIIVREDDDFMIWGIITYIIKKAE